MTESVDILTWLLGKAHANGADKADALMFETVESAISRRMGIPEGIERSENKALGLRVFKGQRQAIVSTTDIMRDTLSELIERAVAMAAAAPEDPHAVLAPESLYCQAAPDLDLLDDREPDASWLAEQCRKAEEAALSVEGIGNSEGADAQYSQNRVTLAIANGPSIGFAGSYRTSRFSLSVSVLAGSGTAMERDYEFSSARHRRDLADASTIGLEAARKALARLHPRKPSTCQVSAVFDPRLSRSLLSTLASSISGNAIARGSSFLKDALHRPLFPESITIIDDPHRKSGLGSRPFDAEGVRNEKRTIVDKGVLATWLLDMRSAHRLGLQTTGHASRSLASPPSPASSNLYMLPGSLTPQDVMRDIKTGVYITETFGMGVNTITGDYSQGAAGFWIENGELVYPISEFTVAGHLRDMFSRLTAANDLTFRYATNAPTLRIDGMTVAGA